MRRARKLVVRAILYVSLGVWASGCATAQPSGRKGILEGPGASESANRFPAFEPHSVSRAVSSAPAINARSAGNPQRRPAVEIAAGSLHWPLQRVQITSPFGKRGKEFHEGIDLKAQQGTPVLAAQDGTVIYAGSKIRGYGKLIVIRHLRQISTIYAHNSQLLVRAGQFVHQGQKISVTGQTGHVTGPHLHFEVRDGLAALNPLDLLPSLRAAVDPVPSPAKPSKRLAAIKPQRVVAVSRAARAVSFSGEAD